MTAPLLPQRDGPKLFSSAVRTFSPGWTKLHFGTRKRPINLANHTLPKLTRIVANSAYAAV